MFGDPLPTCKQRPTAVKAPIVRVASNEINCSSTDGLMDGLIIFPVQLFSNFADDVRRTHQLKSTRRGEAGGRLTGAVYQQKHFKVKHSRRFMFEGGQNVKR